MNQGKKQSPYEKTFIIPNLFAFAVSNFDQMESVLENLRGLHEECERLESSIVRELLDKPRAVHN